MQNLAIKIFGLLILTTVMFSVSDCQGQNHRGWFNRAARIQRAKERAWQQNQAEAFHKERVTRIRQSPHWRDLDDGSSYLDPHHKYPKYIGGFHSSHFSDIGVPTGDKGFRTNGIYWSPW